MRWLRTYLVPGIIYIRIQRSRVVWLGVWKGISGCKKVKVANNMTETPSTEGTIENKCENEWIMSLVQLVSALPLPRSTLVCFLGCCCEIIWIFCSRAANNHSFCWGDNGPCPLAAPHRSTAKKSRLLPPPPPASIHLPHHASQSLAYKVN